jgi:RNA polymerase sigma-70 factor (ECF subfamily)
MSDTPEADLLAAAQAGDDDALAELLARHQDQIYRFGLRMCRDPDDARDVVQDTLLAMARGVRDFRGGSSLSTWLYAIARSYCIKQRRRSKFAPATIEPLDDARAVADPARGPDEDLAGKRLATALEDAIAALEPSYPEVLVLRDVEGLSAAEVAEVVEVSVDAVKSRLHRARSAVRAALAPLLEDPAATSAAGGCPDLVETFSRHLEGEIGPEMCAAMERHLEGCPRCRGQCDALRRSLSVCRSLPAAPVPPAVQRAVRRAVRDYLSERSR